MHTTRLPASGAYCLPAGSVSLQSPSPPTWLPIIVPGGARRAASARKPLGLPRTDPLSLFNLLHVPARAGHGRFDVPIVRAPGLGLADILRQRVDLVLC